MNKTTMNKTWRNLAAIILAAGTILTANQALADYREERFFQLQWDLFGISTGFHLTDLFYVGITHQPRLRVNRLDRGDFRGDDEIYDQRGVDRFDMWLGQKDAIELRISPFEFGLYFSVGVLHSKGDRQEVFYDQRPRLIGNGAYVTDLRVTVQGQSQTSLATGIGFNHVFEFGLSLGVGLLIGLGPTETADVHVEAPNPIGLVPTQSDLDHFKREVEDDFPDLPILFHFAIGYNF